MNGILADNKVGTAWGALLRQLESRMDKRESEQTASAIVNHVLGWTRAERIMRQGEMLSESQLLGLYQCGKRVAGGEPLQYVTGVAWFLGQPFQVNPDVLIPRPETEELVIHALSLLPTPEARVLDIGTGSGCVAISLALRAPAAQVSACDISEGALACAVQNAQKTGAHVHFFPCDILIGEPAGPWDLILSNPPYIPRSEAHTLDPHVREAEPHLALFVDDDRPLLFYERIALLLSQQAFGAQACCEIHPPFAEALTDLGNTAQLETHIMRDAQQRPRILTWKKR